MRGARWSLAFALSVPASSLVRAARHRADAHCGLWAFPQATCQKPASTSAEFSHHCGSRSRPDSPAPAGAALALWPRRMRALPHGVVEYADLECPVLPGVLRGAQTVDRRASKFALAVAPPAADRCRPATRRCPAPGRMRPAEDQPAMPRSGKPWMVYAAPRGDRQLARGLGYPRPHARTRSGASTASGRRGDSRAPVIGEAGQQHIAATPALQDRQSGRRCCCAGPVDGDALCCLRSTCWPRCGADAPSIRRSACRESIPACPGQPTIFRGYDATQPRADRRTFAFASLDANSHCANTVADALASRSF